MDERHDTHEVATESNLLASNTLKFVVTFVFWNKLLQIVNITSQMLQKKESDMLQVVEFMDRVELKYRSVEMMLLFRELSKILMSFGMRSTMTTDRSSDLAFLSIESDVDIHIDDFVDVFIAHKSIRAN